MALPELLAGLRRSRGLSQDRLAELLCQQSGMPTVSREEVSRWERGKRSPSAYWLPWLAQTLDVPRAVLEQAKATADPLDGDLAEQLAFLTSKSVIDSPWTTVGTVAALTATARGGPMDRRGFLIASGSALSAIAMNWTGAEQEVVAASRAGRRLSPELLDILDRQLDHLRRLDDVMGGGDLLQQAVAQYQTMSTLAGEASYDGQLGRRLYSLVSESARICGWTHFDQGMHARAQEYFITSLRASASSGDAAVGAHALAFMTIQTYTVGNPQDAVGLIQTAQEKASRTTTPRVRAMLHARAGRALSKTGDVQGCARELDSARDAFAQGSRDDDPPWIYWMTADEIARTAGSSALELGDPRRAIEHYAAATTGSYARDNALALARAAEAYLTLGDVDAACTTATQAFTLGGDVNSNRPVEALSDFRELLAPHRDARAARDYLELTNA